MTRQRSGAGPQDDARRRALLQVRTAGGVAAVRLVEAGINFEDPAVHAPGDDPDILVLLRGNTRMVPVPAGTRLIATALPDKAGKARKGWGNASGCAGYGRRGKTSCTSVTRTDRSRSTGAMRKPRRGFRERSRSDSRGTRAIRPSPRPCRAGALTATVGSTRLVESGLPAPALCLRDVGVFEAVSV